jgi:hypothetical protein
MSQESECRTGGLNILGSFSGLGYNFDEIVDSIKDNLKFFKRCAEIIPAK